MGAIEKIIELKKQGFSENEIVYNLKEQGFSPKAIKESLSRAKIKSAVSDNTNNYGDEALEPSIMMQTKEESYEPPQRETPNWDREFTPPSPTPPPQIPGKISRPTYEIDEGAPTPQPQEQFSIYSPQQYSQERYYPENYEENYDYETSSENIDTFIEIAEQIFSEKIKTIQKQIEEIEEFKALIEPKISNISDRLKRIENNIDALQLEILEKVGAYGGGIESIKKEMSMMQDSFGKIVNSVADKAEEKHKRVEEHASKISSVKRKQEKNKHKK